MLALAFSINAFAAENFAHPYSESHSYDPGYKKGDITSYRCPNSNCRAFLIYQRFLTTCGYCDSNTHSYKCSHCPAWYSICETGHFNHVDGR